MRAITRSLSYRALPRLMVTEMEILCVLWFNALPKKRFFTTINPKGIIDVTTLEFKRHCKVEFGAYIQKNE